MADGRIRYAGALLKYSFDEVGQDRSVNIVDIDRAGRGRRPSGTREQ
jgi:exonuclease SbcD